MDDGDGENEMIEIKHILLGLWAVTVLAVLLCQVYNPRDVRRKMNWMSLQDLLPFFSIMVWLAMMAFAICG